MVENKRWYPLYHVAAPVGWINDPNGFCTYKGQYHLFYQYHPYSPQWGPMHWGHVVSKDLVHWEHLPIALKPTEPYEKEGCFSGSAIERDGKLYLIYTGNAEVQTQNLAVSDDGINFEKSPDNPIIKAPESDEIRGADFRDPTVWEHDGKFYSVIASKVHGGDFRDPKVWEHDGKYYAVIGSKTTDGSHGQALIYESDDLKNWTFKSIAARAKENEGTMWECPNFAKIGGQDVLIISPMGVNPVGNKFLNAVDSGYMIGKINYKDGIFTRGALDLLDYGTDFYAPQLTQLADGRCVMIGWFAMWFADMPEQADGWAGTMTVPRELKIKKGKLFSVPIEELESLRLDGVTHNKLTITEPTKLDGVEGTTGELIVDVNLAKSDDFSISVRAGEDEQTLLTYDKATSTFAVDRTNSGEGPKDKREVQLSPANTLKIRAFIDRSSVEVFLNGGEYVFSMRIYPKETSQGIIFASRDGKLILNEVSFYKLAEGIPQPEGSQPDRQIAS